MELAVEFNSFIKTNQLVKDSDRVLLAVSGGVDSMVMAHLFLHTDRNFGVAHCNFQLRGIESDLDEQLVSTWCEENGVVFHTKRFDTEGYASAHGVSIQMAARSQRYEWFRNVMDLEDYSQLATAHQRDDNLETILFNLARGTGFAGIAGIPVKAKRIIRPLLFTSRQEITDYARVNNLAWREDKSNYDEKYSRSVIRAQVIPELRKINPSILESFRNTSFRLAEMKELVKLQVKQELSVIVSHEDDKLLIDKEKLQKSRGASTILFEILKGYGFNYEICLQLLSSIDHIGAIFSTESHVLNVDREYLLLAKRDLDDSDDLLITHETRAFHRNGITYTVEILPVENTVLPKDTSIASFDLDAVEYPLVLRGWKEGDRFVPLGMKGTKKVSDLLVDLKVPMIEKERVTVLCSGDEIAWVCGYRLSDHFKVTAKTRQVLRIAPENG